MVLLFEGQCMTRTAIALWLMLLFNAGMSVGILAGGLGRIPFNGLTDILSWFVVGMLLSVVALLFVYIMGMNIDSPDLEDATPRVVRMVVGVAGFGALALVVFVKGIIATLSLLAS